MCTIMAYCGVSGGTGKVMDGLKATVSRGPNPLQYSCLENPMDRGAWWATVHRVAKSRTRLSEQLNSLFSVSLQGYLLQESFLIVPVPRELISVNFFSF